MSLNQTSFASALLSSLAFAAMSLFIKKASQYGVSSIDLTFYRFFFGLCFFIFYFSYQQKLPKVISLKHNLTRAFTNIVAVYLFYLSISLLDLATANLLNLTYPLFICILAPFLLKESFNLKKGVAVAISFFGIYLLLDPSNPENQLGLWIGLLCGFISSLTIMSLKAARRYDSSITIVFIMMLTGSICLAPFYSFSLPENEARIWVILASLMALIGQLSLTFSFARLTSLFGSLISSSRILFAAALGVLFLGESLSLNFIFSFLLISIGIYLSREK